MTKEEFERERPGGSWIEMPDGSYEPNADDEAMAARHGLKAKKGKEVRTDA